MKIHRYYIVLVGLLSFLLAACSATQKTTNEKSNEASEKNSKDSVYVFDEIKTPQPKKTTEVNTPQQNDESKNISYTYYVVQVGAFSTKDRADEFVTNNRDKLQDEMLVSFNPAVNLYVVQLATHYPSHEEAENMRNQLWKINEFKDAWIVTEQK
jgi:cell division septation protein DedD